MALGVPPHDLSSHQKKKFCHDIMIYFWEEPFLYKLCKDGIYWCCFPEEEIQSVILYCMTLLLEGMLALPRSLRRCSRCVSFSSHYSKMSLHMSAPVIVASGWVIYPGRIKFPSNSFSKLISSMFGASTSCDLSHSLGAPNTLWLPWIMLQVDRGYSSH